MKRVGSLCNRIISVENLEFADRMARKGKGNSYGIRLHDTRRKENILKLHEILENKVYKTSHYTVFKIYDPKEREIYRLPYFPDRIVHWAIMLQLEPVWMKVFTRDTYSCIKGRGIHGAARSVAKALNDDPMGTRYCLKLDIKKFYPSIDQEILLNIMKRKIKCKDTLSLLSEIIHSVRYGVPIGNYISQFAANLYLAYFDHWIKETKQVKHYFRYCDDLVILASDKERLQKLLEEVRSYLKINLRLTIKGNFQVFPVASRGVDFVGYVFYHDHIMLRKRIKVNMMKRRAKLIRLKVTNKEYKHQMASYLGWVSQPFASTRHLLKKIA